MNIDSVKYGEITINNKTIYSDVILSWKGKVDLIPKTHQLGFSLALSLVKDHPDAVVVGVGLKGTVTLLEEFSAKLEEEKGNLKSAIDIMKPLCKKGFSKKGIYGFDGCVGLKQLKTKYKIQNPRKPRHNAFQLPIFFLIL